MAYTVSFTTPYANKAKITAEVKEDGTAIDIPALGYTRAVVKIAGVVLDSAIFPLVFDWTGGQSGLLTFDLTDFPYLTGSQKATLSFYTAGSFTAVTVVEGASVTMVAALSGQRGPYENHLPMRMASAIPGCGADMIAIPSPTGIAATLADYIKPTNVGTANTGVTAVEYGDGRIHQTVLTIAKTNAIDIADDAALADGYKIYDFPAGSVIITGTYMTAGVTVASTESQAVNADLGLGTTVASGANAVLSATAGFENVLTGQTTTGCTGTAAVKTVGTQLVIEAADSHSLYLNVAGTWANDTGGDLTGDFAGTVVVNWVFNA